MKYSELNDNEEIHSLSLALIRTKRSSRCLWRLMKMMMCQKASEILGVSFRLLVNGNKVL